MHEQDIRLILLYYHNDLKVKHGFFEPNLSKKKKKKKKKKRQKKRFVFKKKKRGKGGYSFPHPHAHKKEFHPQQCPFTCFLSSPNINLSAKSIPQIKPISVNNALMSMLEKKIAEKKKKIAHFHYILP